MADYAPTASQVKLISGSKGSGTAGATITAGQWLYRDAYTQKLLLADANVTAAAAASVGVALNGASDGQEVDFAGPGSVVDYGAAAAVPAGKVLILSDTAGNATPHTDATTPATGEFGTVLAVGIGNNRILVICAASGVAAA